MSIQDLMQPQIIKEEDNKYLELIIKEIYSKSDIEVKTRLNQQQVNAITKALVFAQKYGVSLLNSIAVKHMELLVSLDGKGRDEFTQITTNMSNPTTPEPQNLFEKLVNK